jgi:hypothetical protein
MKVIISHDVDHITVLEHGTDLIVPKHITRSFIELGLGYIESSEILNRLKDILKNQWQNLEELMTFDKKNNIPSTFFIGVSKGKGLNYSVKDAELWIKEILRQGFDIGVHGIAFNNFNDMKNEYNTFSKLSGLENFGIRMHYLRNDESTLGFLDKAGYLFDTSIYEMKNSFKVDALWEFPLHIMDGYIIEKNGRWQNQNLKQCKQQTERIIEKAFEKGINYFTILFHDRYFCDGFKTWKAWYIWLIQYLKDNKFKFISYREAINELKGLEPDILNASQLNTHLTGNLPSPFL